MNDVWRYALAAAAALAAGLANAIAGGGSLITFPALVAGGLNPVVASLTNTIAMLAGYVSAAAAQRRDLAGQGKRMWRMLPISAVGGVIGAELLLHTNAKDFAALVPYLLLFAAVLLAVQNWLRAWLVAHTKSGHSETWALIPLGLCAVYGGYFGAGIGVILLGVFSIVLGDSLTRLNALKQMITLTVNAAAAIVFVYSGEVDWPIAGVMLIGSLIGGALGGTLASRIPAGVLRWTVIALAVIVAIVYLV